MKYAKVSIQIKFLYKESKAFQYFIIVDTKMKKYVLDKKFLLNKQFENFIEKNALSNIDDDFTFVSRRDDDEKVVLEFTFDENKEIEKTNTYFYTLSGNIPFGIGCEDCKYLKTEEGLYCDKKEKALEQKLKSCRFFSQKENDT